MRNHSAGTSRLFFIEFLIVLFFFLIVSTVCLRLFAGAHEMTADADELSHAQAAAASVAEALKESDGTAPSMADILPEAVVQAAGGTHDSGAADTDSLTVSEDSSSADLTVSEDSSSADNTDVSYLTIYYDQTFTPCRKDSILSAVYTLTALLHRDDRTHLVTADISVCSSDGTVIYQLSASRPLILTREEVLS